ncbi:hypothetical protein BJ742DRAFT_879970 [Cladochytrium replicatum]|nr:hypothetical protein BJ742DRAFT_879970 [Cladochytrium replicatum]
MASARASFLQLLLSFAIFFVLPRVDLKEVRSKACESKIQTSLVRFFTPFLLARNEILASSLYPDPSASCLNEFIEAPAIEEFPSWTVDSFSSSPSNPSHSNPPTNWSLVIHVLAWRRIRSLERLLMSLDNASFTALHPAHSPVRTIDLFIHIDGGSHPNVNNLAHAYTWRYGNKFVIQKKHQIGIFGIMTSAWDLGSSTATHALFLEDDISLSPYFLDFIQLCVSSFLSHRSAIGCALHTPRLDEVNFTADPQNPPAFTPEKVIGKNFSKFYMQLPCSWGGVYSRESWSRFLTYTKKRRADGINIYIPNSRTNDWQRSWKRYFVEYMVGNGFVLLYPSLPSQRSFATNHYEHGVHTVKNGDVVRVPDYLREDPDKRFTVPLVTEDTVAEDWKRLERDLNAQIPVVNLWHSKVVCQNAGKLNATQCALKKLWVAGDQVRKLWKDLEIEGLLI